MIGKEETTYLLNRLFEDCFAFWVNEGKDDKMAFKLALKETEWTTHHPFTPSGDLLDPDAKQEYVDKMRKELE